MYSHFITYLKDGKKHTELFMRSESYMGILTTIPMALHYCAMNNVIFVEYTCEKVGEFYA
jgi:hypothetical protein